MGTTISKAISWPASPIRVPGPGPSGRPVGYSKGWAVRGENHSGELYVIHRANSIRRIRLAASSDDFFTTGDSLLSIYKDSLCVDFVGYDDQPAPSKMIASEAPACYNR